MTESRTRRHTMYSTDSDLQRALAMRAIRGTLLRAKWHVAALRFELALRRHDRALKYGYHPDQPRVRAGWKSTLRHYTNLDRCEARLRRLIQEFRFSTVLDVLRSQQLLAGDGPVRSAVAGDPVRTPATQGAFAQ